MEDSVEASDSVTRNTDDFETTNPVTGVEGDGAAGEKTVAVEDTGKSGTPEQDSNETKVQEDAMVADDSGDPGIVDDRGDAKTDVYNRTQPDLQLTVAVEDTKKNGAPEQDSNETKVQEDAMVVDHGSDPGIVADRGDAKTDVYNRTQPDLQLTVAVEDTKKNGVPEQDSNETKVQEDAMVVDHSSDPGIVADRGDAKTGVDNRTQPDLQLKVSENSQAAKTDTEEKVVGVVHNSSRTDSCTVKEDDAESCDRPLEIVLSDEETPSVAGVNGNVEGKADDKMDTTPIDVDGDEVLSAQSDSTVGDKDLPAALKNKLFGILCVPRSALSSRIMLNLNNVGAISPQSTPPPASTKKAGSTRESPPSTSPPTSAKTPGLTRESQSMYVDIVGSPKVASPASDVTNKSDGDGSSELQSKSQWVNGHNYACPTNSEKRGFSSSDDSPASNRQSPMKRLTTPKRSSGVIDDKWLVPLKNGWVREVVYRATTDTKASRNADIYYHSPSKVKLRSGREIETFLKKTKVTNLGVENFTFGKMQIYHSPQEILREAGKRSVAGKKVASKVTSPPKKVTSKVTSPPVKVDKPKPVVTPKSKKKKKKRKLSNASSDAPPPKIRRTYEVIKPAGNLLRLKLKKNAVTQAVKKKIKKPVPPSTPKKDMAVPCSLTCSGQRGVLPSLYCGLCLCLYHPACVNLPNDKKPFICIKCIQGRTSRKISPQNQNENTPQRLSDDDFRFSPNESPVSLEVRADVFLDDSDGDVTAVGNTAGSPLSVGRRSLSSNSSTPSQILPTLMQKPSLPTAGSLIANRLPPPLKLAPSASLPVQPKIQTFPAYVSQYVRVLAQKPPPPLKLGDPKSIFPSQLLKNGNLNRPPPPLTPRPGSTNTPIQISLVRTYGKGGPSSTIPILAVRSSGTSGGIVHNGTNILNATVSSSAPNQASGIQVMPTNGIFQNVSGTLNLCTNTTTGASPYTTVVTSTPGTVGSTILRNSYTVSTKNTVPPLKVVTPAVGTPKAVMVQMMNSRATTEPTTDRIGTMKFVLKTNSGTMTEVTVPQLKGSPGNPNPQPKYIVVNKEGKPTGLVVGVGNKVVQLPILNQLCGNESEKLLKDAVTASITTKEGGYQEIKLVPDGTSVLKKNTAPPDPKTRTPQLVNHNSLLRQQLSTPLVASTTTNEVEVEPTTVVISNKSETPKTTRHKVARQRNLSLPNPGLCNMQKLICGVKALRKVFHYLRQDDLARASCVDTTWRWLASQSELWRSIRLDGIKVGDWETLVEVIKKQRSLILDMRGMTTFEDKNRTWHGFAAILGDLGGIREIYFGHVPVSILHTVASSLVKLEVLTAEFITDISNKETSSTSNCRLDIGQFSQVKGLKQLRLRGVCGIQLPTVITSPGLSSMDILTKLRHLSLTSLKDVPPSDFVFLTSLHQLTALALGDCTSWEDEHFRYFEKFNRLRRLRLEHGGPIASNGLAETLSSLHSLKHLELYRFTLEECILSAVSKLPQLRQLSLFPDINQESHVVNTAVFDNVLMPQLQYFVWGVTVDEQRAKQDDEVKVVNDRLAAQRKNMVQCIPLKLTDEVFAGVSSIQEYLNWEELKERVTQRIPATRVQLHPSDSPIIFSRIKYKL